MPAPASERRHWLVLFLLGVLCLLPGVLGRDPWKADEAYSFGMVLEMLQRGDWVVPTLGGEPFMEKPPIMYITATLCAKALGGVLPLHDAARLAALVFNALTLAALGLASREMWGARRWWLGPVLFLGALGPMHTQHMLMTDVALLTGFALGHAGLALCLRQPRWGGLLLGTGLGVAFLAKGLLGPGLMSLTALLLPIFKPWRTKGYFQTLLVAGVAALPWVVIWPALLYFRSPSLFREWLIVNNFGRFAGTSGLGPKNVPFFYFRLLPWFALPVLPLALWTMVKERREVMRQPALQLALVSFLVMLAVLSLAGDGRSLYAQPMLVPLALAAIPAVDWMDGRLGRGLAGFVAGLAILLGAGAWLAFGLIQAGVPAKLQHWLQAQVPQYVPGIEWLPLLGGILVIGAALICWKGPGEALGRTIVFRWAVTTGMIYGLGMTLFLPIVNTNMTYRITFGELAKHLPEVHGPVASHGLGEPQRGLLHYYAGLRTLRVEIKPEALATADLVLVQGNYRDNVLMGPPAQGPWNLLWEGRRGGRESFRLYRRAANPPQAGTVPLPSSRTS